MAELDLDNKAVYNEYDGPPLIQYGNADYEYTVKRVYPFVSKNPQKAGEQSMRVLVTVDKAEGDTNVEPGQDGLLHFKTGCPKAGVYAARRFADFICAMNGTVRTNPKISRNAMVKEAVEAGDALAELGIRMKHVQRENEKGFTEYKWSLVEEL